MQRGSLISMRTWSLQVGHRESLFECAVMLVLQRGQVMSIGMEGARVPCSFSPGFGEKKARAPVAMVVPAQMIAAIARMRNMSSS